MAEVHTRICEFQGEPEIDQVLYAYLLRSEKNPERFYYGFSSDLKKRIKFHNQGGNASTKTGAPWTLAWYGGFESESAAIDFERYLKTASGKAFARKRLFCMGSGVAFQQLGRLCHDIGGSAKTPIQITQGKWGQRKCGTSVQILTVFG